MYDPDIEEALKQARKLQRREWQKRYQERHPEMHKKQLERTCERRKERYRTDPEFRQKVMDYTKAYQKANPDKVKQWKRKYKPTSEQQRNRLIKHKYGVTTEQYKLMLEAQGGVCAICGNGESKIDGRWKRIRRLSIDHCHTTGKVRGLLCASCNHGIANFKDNTDTMKKAIEYLLK